jgi:hypothetical protein
VNDSLFSHLFIPKINETVLVGAEEIITAEANEYLYELNIPYSLLPDIDSFIQKCSISGYDAYYFVSQKPKEVEARIRMIFDGPDGKAVFVNADSIDWEEGAGEADAIQFLSNFFKF